MWKKAIKPRDPTGKICSFYCAVLSSLVITKNKYIFLIAVFWSRHLVTHMSVLASNSHITATITDVLVETTQLFTTIM